MTTAEQNGIESAKDQVLQVLERTENHRDLLALAPELFKERLKAAAAKREAEKEKAMRRLLPKSVQDVQIIPSEEYRSTLQNVKQTLLARRSQAAAMLHEFDMVVKQIDAVDWLDMKAARIAMTKMESHAGKAKGLIQEIDGWLAKGELNASCMEVLGKALKHDTDMAALQNVLIRAVDNVIEEKALRTYAQSKKPDDTTLGKIVSLAKIGLGVGAKFIPNGYKWTASLSNFLLDFVNRIESERNISAEVKAFTTEHARGVVMLEHDKDKLLFIRGVYKDHQDNIELILSGASVGASDLPGWGYACTAVTRMTKRIFERKIKEAEKLIEPGEPEPQASFFVKVRDTLKDEFIGEDAAPGDWLAVATTAPGDEPGEGETVGGNISDAVLGKLVTAFIKVIVDLIVDELPLEPAPFITGEDLQAYGRNMQESILAGTNVIIDRRPYVARQRVRPAQDKDGNPVELVLTDVLTSDGRDYQWVKIGDWVGVLYHDDLVFDRRADGVDVPVQLTALRKSGLAVPSRITAGDIPIEEIDLKHVDSNLEKGWFYGRIVSKNQSLWGRITTDGDTVVFTFLRPDATAHANWSDRMVDKSSYTPRGGAAVAGTWHRPVPNGALLFVRTDGTREWGRPIDKCRNSSREEYRLGDLVTRFVKPGPPLSDFART